jgi:hypothetical protein
MKRYKIEGWVRTAVGCADLHAELKPSKKQQRRFRRVQLLFHAVARDLLDGVLTSEDEELAIDLLQRLGLKLMTIVASSIPEEKKHEGGEEI